MKQRKTQSPLDNEEVYRYLRDILEAGATNATAVQRLEDELGILTSKDSIRRFRGRHKIAIPGQQKAHTTINGDNAEGATQPLQWHRDKEEMPILSDPDQMLRDRGLDPEEWEITSLTVNEWNGPQQEGTVVTYYQAKFTCRRRKPQAELLPARTDGPRIERGVRKLPQGDPELVVIVGDHQAPFHDRRLHELFCNWLEVNEPHRGINLGDKMDFPDISRHPDDPDNVAFANECIQAAYDIDYDIALASSDTEWKWMPGNHDERLRRYVIDKAPKLHGLKRADTLDSYGEVVHDISYLTRCDELGIEYVDPRGPYDLAQIQLSQNLAVRHGWIVRQKGGESAYKSLEKTGYSILVGHTHRQAIVQHTVPEISGKSRQLLAAEIGCMCRLDDAHGVDGRIFPSYTPMADWQQGFAVVRVWNDQKFHVSLASYVNGVLLWEDQRYD